MKRYMLDTNIVSSLIKKNPNVVKRITSVSITSLCISSITEGELLFGLSKHPHTKNLRANMERKGKILAPLDILIAANAVKADAVLVTNDKAFKQVADLKMEDWT